MPYHVAKNGEKSGPFEKEEVYRRLVSGELSGTDLGWQEGMTEWEPLAKLLPPQGAAVPAGAPVFGSMTANVQAVPVPQTSGLAVASMVCGFLSIVTLGLSGLAAIIMGHLAQSQIRKSAGAIKGSGMALTGLITGYLFFGLTFIAVAASLAVPAFNAVQRQGNQMKAVVNAKQLVIGMKQYAADHDGSLPPTLETLFEEGIVADRKLLDVPGTLKANGGWEYSGAGLKDSGDGNTVILISRESYYKGDRIVAHLDGSVTVDKGTRH